MALLNEVTAITIQISQFIHFQLRLRENASGKQFIGFIVTNWNKSCNIYYKEGGFIICAIFIAERAKLSSKAGRIKTRAVHFWNFLPGLPCKGNLTFRLQCLFAIINKLSKLVSGHWR